MTRTDLVIAESGITVSDEERAMLATEATRASNMTGGRYSDHLRSELATFAHIGSDAYRRQHDEATRIARQIGY